MSAPKKPRSDSPLRTLPEQRQADIIELMKSRSIEEVRKELAKDGFKTSSGALSMFWSWWHLRQQFKLNESSVEQLMDEIRKEEPGLSDEKVFNYGQRMFAILAMKKEDTLDWSRIQKNADRKEIVALEKKKFQRETCKLFLKWVADEEAKSIATSTASNSEKIEQLGKKMFGEDWD